MSADEPELRDRPPWVMEEMIDAESALPTEISGQGGVPLLTRRISETVSAGAQIVVCGCGTSEHAARAISAIIHEARPTARVVATDAFETRLDPPGDGLLIAISHGATTTATRKAATQAAGRGARVVFITACPDAAPEAVEVAATPLYDRSWCHTVAYLSPILTCALGAGLDVSAARALIERELAARGRRRADAGVLAGCDRLLITASGVDEITASELALKIEEAVHMPCTPLGTEKVLHGHLPAADSRTGIVLIRLDPVDASQRDERAGDVVAATAVLAMPAVTITTPTVTRSEALIAGALALQLLTLELATLRGTNPDLIRRDEPLYRRVAEVGRAG
jgi:glucosamine--fructose-6-phosphate aminotransferase (isomerizing)